MPVAVAMNSGVEHVQTKEVRMFTFTSYAHCRRTTQAGAGQDWSTVIALHIPTSRSKLRVTSEAQTVDGHDDRVYGIADNGCDPER